LIPRLELDPFAGRKQKKPELVEIAKAGADDYLSQYRKVFDNIIAAGFVERQYKRFDTIIEEQICKGGLDNIPALKPDELDVFMHRLIDGEVDEMLHDKAKNNIIGLYMSALMNRSYNAGFNDFVLTPGDYAIYDMGHALCGTVDDPIRLRIDGNVGPYCGNESRQASIGIGGEIICGLLGSGLGVGAALCEFGVESVPKDEFGYTGYEGEPVWCTFETHSEKVYEALYSAKWQGKPNNIIVLLGKEDKELMRRTI
jgi:hypothetical protein